MKIFLSESIILANICTYAIATSESYNLLLNQRMLNWKIGFILSHVGKSFFTPTNWSTISYGLKNDIKISYLWSLFGVKCYIAITLKSYGITIIEDKRNTILRVNSHGRFVSVYYAVHQTLVSAFLHVEANCNLQLAAHSSGLRIAAYFWLSVAVLLQLRKCDMNVFTFFFNSRNCNVAFTLCVSCLDCWSALFKQMILAFTRRLRWYQLQVAIRVSCFKRSCTKTMRYIYHPQRDCYLDVKPTVCCRPCELTLSTSVLNS